MTPYELKDGDTVQFGVKTSPDLPAEFLYEYCKALKIKRVRSNDKSDGAHQESVKRIKMESGVLTVLSFLCVLKGSSRVQY